MKPITHKDLYQNEPLKDQIFDWIDEHPYPIVYKDTVNMLYLRSPNQKDLHIYVHPTQTLDKINTLKLIYDK